MNNRQAQVRSQREVFATGVTVAGTHEPFVDGVAFTAPGGAVTVVPCDPGLPQVALALAIGGRVALAGGEISVGGSTDRADLQVRTRLVDVADVTAPEDTLALRAVVAEELALAERPSSRADVDTYLADRDLSGLRQRRWESLPAGLRTRLLIELGSWHPRVRVLVLAGPDRHGGDVGEWFESARQVADSGLTVIVLCSPATAAALQSLTPSGAFA
ncbi:hypothetical protein [Humibacillus xanthopallidus]|uniref:ABC transporter family protein n=1 Tax=Humibacillus xanthopallidus TaxID=412689 RepID=A0A543HVX8_9MICO|nr:hypothetical protein [Humibacillus xanthopallidus]TQM62466.1 hypothetical protein FBY41_2498 [Humibacillus xanthopallidus]